jgi:hypothetical protein
MSFLSRLGKVWSGVYHGAGAWTGWAWDLVTSPVSNDAEQNGIWHAVSHAATSGTVDAFGKSTSELFGPQTGLGAAIGGIPHPVRQPGHYLGEGLNWSYDNLVSHPLATAFTAFSLADQQNNPANQWLPWRQGSVTNPHTWSQAYNISAHRSPGQAAWLGIKNYATRIGNDASHGNIVAPSSADPSVDITNEHDVDRVENEDWFKFTSGATDAVTRWYYDPVVLGARAASAGRVRYIKPVGRTGDVTKELGSYVESDRYSRFRDSVLNKTKNAAEIRSKYFPRHPEGQTLATALDAARHDPELFNDTMRAGFGDMDALDRVGQRNAFLSDMLATKLGQKQGLLINLTDGAVPDSYAVLPEANRIDLADRAAMKIRPMDKMQVQGLFGSLVGYAQPRNALALRNRARVMIHQNGLYGSTLVSRVLPLGRMPHLLDHNRADSDVKLRDWLSHSPLEPERQGQIVDNYIRASSPEAKFQVTIGAEAEAVQSLAERYGLSKNQAQKIVNTARQGQITARTMLGTSQKFVSDKLAAGATDAEVSDGLSKLARNLVPDETGTILTELPMLASQTADYTPLVNLRAFERDLRRAQPGIVARNLHAAANYADVASPLAGAALEKAGNIAAFRPKLGGYRLDTLATDTADSLTKYWKAANLLRLGWPMRVVGDETLRLMSMFGAMATLKWLRPGLSNVALNTRDRWFPAWAKSQDYKHLQQEANAARGAEAMRTNIDQYRQDNPNLLPERPEAEGHPAPFDPEHPFARPMAGSTQQPWWTATTPETLEDALASGMLAPKEYATEVYKRAQYGMVPPHEATVYDALKNRRIDQAEWDRNVIENGLHTAASDRFTDPRWQDDLLQRAASGESITVDPLRGDEFVAGHAVRLSDHETTVPIDGMHADHLYDFVHQHLDALTHPGVALTVQKAGEDGVRLGVSRLHPNQDEALAQAEGLGGDLTDLGTGKTRSFAPPETRPPDWIAGDLKDLRKNRARGMTRLAFRSQRTGRVYVADGAYQGDGNIYHQLASSHPAFSRIYGQDYTPPNTWASLVDREAQTMHNRMRATGKWTTIHPNDDAYPQAWERAASQLAYDPMASRFLAGDDDDAVLHWLEHTAEGKAHAARLPYRAHHPESWVHEVGQMVDEYVPPDAGNLRRLVLDGEGTHAALKEALPDVSAHPPVHGEQLAHVLGPGSKVVDVLNKSIERGYRMMGTLPTDTLTRHPFFAAQYKAHLLSQLNAQEQFAQHAGRELSEVDMARIERKSRERALADVRSRLYDLTNDSQFAHAVRFLAPFYPAWKESLSVWGQLSVENPQIIPHIWQVWNAPDKAGLVQHRDGEQYILLPKWMNDWPGVPKGFRQAYNKQNFNLALQITPGAGPLVSVPVNEVAKRRPDLSDNAIAKWALPYGASSSSTQLVMPAAYRRISAASAGLDDRSYAGMVATIYATEMVDYNLGKRSTRPTFKEAEDKTAKLYKLRAAANFSLPASPTFFSPYQHYIDIYRSLKQKDPEHADEIFYNRYKDAYFPLTGTVTKSVDGVPATIGGYKSEQKYKDLIGQYPELGGLITGSEGAGSFSKAVYEFQLANRLGPGSTETERRVLSPQERANSEQVRLGWIKYSSAMDLIQAEMQEKGLTSLRQRGAEELAQLKANVVADLGKQSPGWYDDYLATDPGKQRRMFEGIRKVVQDPRLRGRPEIQGLADYMHARDLIQQELAQRASQKGGAATLAAKSNADLATLWENVVGDIVQDNVSFAQTYNRYLSNDTLEF